MISPLSPKFSNTNERFRQFSGEDQGVKLTLVCMNTDLGILIAEIAYNNATCFTNASSWNQ